MDKFSRFIFIYIMVLFATTPGYSGNAIVRSTKRIVFEEFPDAYNPSMIKVDKGYLLAFRFTPSRYTHAYLSYIGVVLLDEDFEPISKPQLLKTRPKNSKTPSQAEDPRLFTYKGRIFLIYNDNIDMTAPSVNYDRRDMFVAELFFNEGQYSLSAPRKLIYEEKYEEQIVQKNWSPFEYNDMLYLTYSVNPHEILSCNLNNGLCHRFQKTQAELYWDWGSLRGSTPPLLDDGEFIAFFHSSIETGTPSSWGYEMWHYFMGAYTFSSSPPFQMIKMSPCPIIADGFYTQSSFYKRVIFPGGCVISGPTIYVAYGKDDSEIWIAVLDKEALKQSLIPVKAIVH